MKQGTKRGLSLLLAVLLTLSLLPVSALAAEGWFYLTVETASGLLIAPERLSYSPGQTIAQALEDSDHVFDGLEQGNIYAVDGFAGNFTRSAEDGGYVLDRPASEIRFFCITERMDSRPSASLQKLIAAMGDYAQEGADVKAAAKTAYAAALEQYCDAADGQDVLAETLAEAITAAVEDYRSLLEGETFSVSFTDISSLWQPGDGLWAENAYGLRYEDERGSGTLKLPAGEYTFHMEGDGCGAEGSISVPAQQQVTVALPGEDWLVQDTFRLSASGGTEFEDSLLAPETTGGRSWQAAIPDSYSGRLYSWWDYNESLSWNGLPALYAIYTPAGQWEESRVEQTLRSARSSIAQVLDTGLSGNTVIYRLCAKDDQGVTLYQDTRLELVRTPTLKNLTVTDDSGAPQSGLPTFDPAVTDYTYQVLTGLDTLQITAESFGGEDEGYTLLVNGQKISSGTAATVTLNTEEDTVIPVTVQGGGQETIYTLTFQHTGGVAVNIRTTQAGVELAVYDVSGQKVPYASCNAANGLYRYRLNPQSDYTYVATWQDYFHASRSFTTGDTAMTMTAEVQTENGLSDLSLGGGPSDRDSLPLEQTFDPALHSYTATVPDTEPSVYLWIESGLTASTFQTSYQQLTSTSLYDGKTRTADITPGKSAGTMLRNLLMSGSGYGNTVTVQISRQDGAVTYSQDYVVTLRRQLSLKNLSAACMEQSLPLVQSDGTRGYTPTVTDYQVTVPAAVTRLELTGELYADNGRFVDNRAAGYHGTVNGQTLTSGESLTLELNGTAAAERVEIAVTCDYAPGVETIYTVTVLKAAPVEMVLTTQPEGALLYLNDTLSGHRVWPEGNVYALSEGFTYEYALTAAGYVGATGQIATDHDETTGAVILRLGENVWPVEETPEGLRAQVTMTLAVAPENTTLQTNLPAVWADFRGTSYDDGGNIGGAALSNNTVLDAKLPVSSENSTLYWATAVGSGFDSEAVGCPLLVNGDLITYAGQTLYRVDRVSGEILAQSTMERSSSFAITPPTYAKGMLFVGLSDGTVQAFDAVTLESLWVYHDPLTGQPNSPIVVYGDYLYTGFWRSETDEANFVCLSITDENPDNDREEKTACWRWTQKGGFYWAGAYVCDDYLLVGTDDGKAGYLSETGSLLLLDPKTGALLDSWTGLKGDVRSSICYDSDTDSFCFTSKGGCFYQARVERQEGVWHITARKSLALDNGGDDPRNPPMSTCTPVVYQGRAYVGVAGTGQFTACSGHNLSVIDLSTMRLAYSVPTMGYVQTSGVLTTAYEDSGYVYVYFFENYRPGRLRVLRDKPGQKQADYVTEENGLAMPYTLFTPTGEQAEYAICSPIVDENGVIYFKNDSGYLMAFGPSVSLEVTAQPEKTAYQAGETFDPAGMRAELVYANGQRLDVTEYLLYSTDPLTTEDKAVTLRFPYVLYHDGDTGDGHTEGVRTQTPIVQVSITVSEGTEAPTVRYGDVNSDGIIDLQDVLLVQRYVAKRIDASRLTTAAADVNGDSIIDLQDVLLIQRYVAKRISRFPVE